MTTSKVDSKVSGTMLEARNSFLLQVALGALKPQADIHWGGNQNASGYNPDMQRLEAVVGYQAKHGL